MRRGGITRQSGCRNLRQDSATVPCGREELSPDWYRREAPRQRSRTSAQRGRSLSSTEEPREFQSSSRELRHSAGLPSVQSIILSLSAVLPTLPPAPCPACPCRCLPLHSLQQAISHESESALCGTKQRQSKGRVDREPVLAGFLGPLCARASSMASDGWADGLGAPRFGAVNGERGSPRAVAYERLAGSLRQQGSICPPFIARNCPRPTLHWTRG